MIFHLQIDIQIRDMAGEKNGLNCSCWKLAGAPASHNYLY